MFISKWSIKNSVDKNKIVREKKRERKRESKIGYFALDYLVGSLFRAANILYGQRIQIFNHGFLSWIFELNGRERFILNFNVLFQFFPLPTRVSLYDFAFRVKLPSRKVSKVQWNLLLRSKFIILCKIYKNRFQDIAFYFSNLSLSLSFFF